MNIIGESFNPYVDTQIKTRQSKLGRNALNGSNSPLIYSNSNSPYIKLISGINVSAEKCSEIGIATSFADEKLAKEFMLFGGTYSSNSGPKLGVASSYNTSPTSISSYGFVSDSDYGLVPMPGILSANIKSLNRGSIRECEIKLKCYNRFQFNIIEALFLRLKYSFLLEYGHSVYYNNEGELITTPETIQETFFKKRSQQNILNSIEEKREYTGGNYDAFLGYVKNFNWSLNTDGSYDISIKGITPGDVIESIKMNVKSYDSEDEKEQETSGDTSVEKNKDKTSLNQLFHSLIRKTSEEDSKTTYTALSGVVNSSIASGIVSGLELVNLVPEQNFVKINKIEKELLPEKMQQTLTGKRLEFYNKFSEQVESEALRIEFSFDNDDTGEEQLYVKLGYLLKFIRLFGLYYDTTKEDLPPIIDLDFDYETNICFTVPEQFPLDPRVCLIPVRPDFYDLASTTDRERNGWSKFIQGSESFTNELQTSLNQFSENVGTSFKTDYPYVGRLMDIHVNCNFVSQIMDQNQDKNGDIDLHTLLTKMVEGIGRALGGINKFMVNIDNENNTIIIRDESHVPGGFAYLSELKQNGSELAKQALKNLTPSKPPPPTRLNTTLLREGEGGTFVYDVKIQSSITKDIANMITIGAQANGNVVGENATAFSSWNKGLTDRIVVKKQEPVEVGQQKSLTPKQKFKNYYKNVLLYLQRVITLKLDEDDIEQYSESFRPYLRYVVGEKSKPSSKTDLPEIAPIGFIPLSLDIKMLGISGIKIYQKYTITEDLLPPNYRNKIQFLTKGVNHNIDLNGWTTTIDGQSIPIPESKADNGKKSPELKLDFSNGQNPVKDMLATRTGYEDQPTYEQYVEVGLDPTLDQAARSDRPNANALRIELKRLGYVERHLPMTVEGELTSGGKDINKEIAFFATVLFQEIKRQLPEIQLEVTSGDDLAHRGSGLSRHPKGNAIDFIILPRPQLLDNKTSPPTFDAVGQQRINQIETILKGFLVGDESGKAGYLNEYYDVKKSTTGPHFHISWQKGTESKKEIAQAKLEYQQGKFSKIYRI